MVPVREFLDKPSRVNRVRLENDSGIWPEKKLFETSRVWR